LLSRSSFQYVQAEKEGHLASKKFLQAAQRVSDRRTIDALMLLAENYEYRAKLARARNPRPAEDEEKQEEKHAEDTREEKQTEVDAETEQSPDPKVGQQAETQLNVAAAEMEELWRRLNEIGLSSPGSADKVSWEEAIGVLGQVADGVVVHCRMCSCRRGICRRRWEIPSVCCPTRRGD
jgi:hypothetical protein